MKIHSHFYLPILLFVTCLISSCSSSEIKEQPKVSFDSVHISRDFTDSIANHFSSVIESNEMFKKWDFNPENADTSKRKGHYFLEIYKLVSDSLIGYQIDLKVYRNHNPLLSTILKPQDVCQFKMNSEKNDLTIYDSEQNKFIPYHSTEGKALFSSYLVNE